MNDLIHAVFFRALGWAGAYLPRTLAYAIADFVGYFSCLLAPARRRVALHNMRLVLGESITESEVRRYARRVFGNFYRNHIELGLAFSHTPDELFKTMTLHNVENLENALSKGRGVLMLSCHIGNWEYGGLALSPRYPMNAVVWRLSPRMEYLFNQRRARTGFKPLFTDDARLARNILNALKANEIVVFLSEGAGQSGSIEARLFGELRYFPKGPLFFADKAGAAIVPTFVMRDDHHGLHVTFDPEVEMARDEDGRMNETKTWERILPHIEHHIRRKPDQWVWILPEERGAKSEV